MKEKKALRGGKNYFISRNSREYQRNSIRASEIFLKQHFWWEIYCLASSFSVSNLKVARDRRQTRKPLKSITKAFRYDFKYNFDAIMGIRSRFRQMMFARNNKHLFCCLEMKMNFLRLFSRADVVRVRERAKKSTNRMIKNRYLIFLCFLRICSIVCFL